MPLDGIAFKMFMILLKIPSKFINLPTSQQYNDMYAENCSLHS